jgi:hypothetical protein
MEDENISKKENEIYCPECAKPIKRNAVICPNCGIQVKALQYEPVKNTEISASPKSRKVALWLVLFLGIFSWFYTFSKDWWRFFICIFVIFIITFIGRINEALLFIIGVIFYLWPAVNVTIRKDSFYENYPIG